MDEVIVKALVMLVIIQHIVKTCYVPGTPQPGYRYYDTGTLNHTWRIYMMMQRAYRKWFAVFLEINTKTRYGI